MRAAWDEYHQVGDALRSEELVATTARQAATQSARFAALLEAEPTVLAPRTVSRHRSNWLRYGLPGASAAAAVAMVAWIAFPQLSGESQQLAGGAKPALATSVIPVSQSQSGQSGQPGVDPVQLQEYLSAHRQFSVGAMQAVDFSGVGSVAPAAAIPATPAAAMPTDAGLK